MTFAAIAAAQLPLPSRHAPRPADDVRRVVPAGARARPEPPLPDGEGARGRSRASARHAAHLARQRRAMPSQIEIDAIAGLREAGRSSQPSSGSRSGPPRSAPSTRCARGRATRSISSGYAGSRPARLTFRQRRRPRSRCPCSAGVGVRAWVASSCRSLCSPGSRVGAMGVLSEAPRAPSRGTRAVGGRAGRRRGIGRLVRLGARSRARRRSNRSGWPLLKRGSSSSRRATSTAPFASSKRRRRAAAAPSPGRSSIRRSSARRRRARAGWPRSRIRASELRRQPRPPGRRLDVEGRRRRLDRRPRAARSRSRLLGPRRRHRPADVARPRSHAGGRLRDAPRALAVGDRVVLSSGTRAGGSRASRRGGSTPTGASAG